MTFLAAFLIFVGILAFGVFQIRISHYGLTLGDFAGVSFGCGLMVAGATLIVGA